MRDLNLPKIAKAFEDALTPKKALAPKVQYTVEDIEPIIDAVGASFMRFDELPDELKSKAVMPTMIDELLAPSVRKLEALQSAPDGITVECYVEFLKVNEVIFGYYERVLSPSGIDKIYSSEGLGAKDIQIMRDLGLHKFAEAYGKQLTSIEPAPKEPAKDAGVTEVSRKTFP